MILPAAQIRNELEPRVATEFADPSYALPALDYITDDFLPWFHRHLITERITYRKHVYDCDDFARQFAASLVDAARTVNIAAGLAVAVLTVRNIVTSLGIPAGRHALNLVGVKTRTAHQWLVVEPQNQRHVPLALYHTADHLRAAF